MLKKLRRKVILINMCLVSVVLLAALVVICIQMHHNDMEDLYRGLEQAANFALKPDGPVVVLDVERSGDGLKRPVAQSPNVVVTVADNGEVTVLHEDGVSFSDTLLEESVALALKAPETYGKLPRQGLAFYKRDLKGQRVLALGDLSAVTASLQRSILVCIALFLAGTLVFFFISLGLSSIAVKPIDEAWQQQRRFVADASHELKTPLTVIMANNNIVSAHRQETVAQQDQWLRSTAEEAQHMRELIDQMLQLARADAGQQRVELRPVNCSELVEAQALCFEPVAYEREVTLETRLQPQVVLQSDPQLLQQLTAILVDNAIKYSAPGHPVVIRLEQNGVARLSVHNDGAPIPLEDLPHIFDRFYRSDKARASSGYGLGLSIAQSIAQTLHGTLSVKSSEAAGTTFTAEFRK